MRTSASGYVFSFSDFNPSRRLSATVGEPAIAGHIRWLKRRAQQLLPGDADLEFHGLCHDWWIEAFHDECVMQREAKWSAHARFDLEETDDGDYPDFPSDTEPVVLGAWLSHVLESGEPNPHRKLRSRRGDGTRRRAAVRLHEMLATLALSELHQATVLLVEDPKENATTVAGLLMSASELMNRSEMHLWASARPVAAGSSTSPRIRRKEFTGPVVAVQEPLNRHQARVTRGAASLVFEYGGERRILRRVSRGGSLTLGFSMLLDLLEMPACEVPLHSLDLSYRNEQLKRARATSDRTSPNSEIVDSPERRRVKEMAAAIKQCRENDRLDEAQRLLAEMEDYIEEHKLEEQRSAGAVQDGKVLIRPQASSPRIAIQNAGRRLKDAIGRLETEFPELGRHLAASIKGRVSEHVRYDPSPSVEWVIEEIIQVQKE